MRNAVNGEGEKKNRLFNFRPALFAALFLVFGIVFSFFRIKREISYLWLLTLLPLLLIPLAFSEDGRDFLLRLVAVLALAIFFCVGAVSFRLQTYVYQQATVYEGSYSVVGEVESWKEKDESMQLVLTNLYIGEEKAEGRMKVYLPVYKAEKVRTGDKVLLRGEVSTDTSLFNEYGFRDSDVSKKRYYRMTSEEDCIRIGKSDNLFLIVRARMEKVVYEGMNEDSAALTLALLTGDVTGVDEELMDNMRYGGIAHIFAVSGLNVGALYGCCIFLFSRKRLLHTPKPLRFFLLLAILIFYSGVCGFSASVVRAAIACAVLYFAKLLGTSSDFLNALGVAAILILLLSPVELVGVGFQLSFTACLGLFLLMKPTTQVFDEIKNLYLKRFPRKYTEEERRMIDEGDTVPMSIGGLAWRFVTDLLSASIAAQVMTAPVLLIRFGYLSGWSLLLNFFFVPIMDALFTVLLLITTVACLLPTSFAGVLLYLPSRLWLALVLLFEIADFSTFGISDLQISFAICVCYYGALLFLTDKLNISKRLRAVWFCLFFLTFALCLHIYNV